MDLSKIQREHVFSKKEGSCKSLCENPEWPELREQLSVALKSRLSDRLDSLQARARASETHVGHFFHTSSILPSDEKETNC